MSFAEVHAAHPWDEVLASVRRKTEADVLRALARAEADQADLEDFKALVSPAAAPHLERMARLSHERTLRRYGRTMQLFAPAYLSNECQNVCTYCGFSAGNKVPRRTLNPGEILREAGALKKLGFDHLLILTGESNKVAVPYFVQALDLLRPHFSSLSMEVQPMETEEYAELRRHRPQRGAGLSGDVPPRDLQRPPSEGEEVRLPLPPRRARPRRRRRRP
jgi:2-iminoacetate synthase